MQYQLHVISTVFSSHTCTTATFYNRWAYQWHIHGLPQCIYILRPIYFPQEVKALPKWHHLLDYQLLITDSSWDSQPKVLYAWILQVLHARTATGNQFWKNGLFHDYMLTFSSLLTASMNGWRILSIPYCTKCGCWTIATNWIVAKVERWCCEMLPRE